MTRRELLAGSLGGSFLVWLGQRGLAAIGASPGAGPQAGRRYRLTTDLRIPASSTVDVAEAIAQAVGKLPDVSGETSTAAGAPTMVVLEGMYRIDRPLVLRGMKNLRIVGGTNASGFIRTQQATKPQGFPPKTPWYAYLDVRDCRDLILEKFAIRGPLTTPTYDRMLEQAAGIHVAGASQRVTIRDVFITGVHGDFVGVAEDHLDQPTEILLENVRGEVAGRQMVADVGGKGLTIRRCYFKQSGRSGLDIEPSTPLGSHNITVEDSVFESPKLFCVAGGNSRPHRNVVIRRTKFLGGLGLIKYATGKPEEDDSHQGLYLEDVSYEWLPNPVIRGKSLYRSITIMGTKDIRFIRVRARFNGPSGRIEGTGEVRDSVFTSDMLPGSTPVVYLCGVADVRNVGTGGCVPADQANQGVKQNPQQTPQQSPQPRKTRNR